MYRHGDVILIQAEIPSKAQQIRDKDVVLAYGEVTGHSHKIPDGAIMFKYNDKDYVRITKPMASLLHEEHGRLELLKGDYEIIIQNEWQENGWTNVID